MAEFYSARGWEIPPLPWTNLSPPFSCEIGADMVALLFLQKLPPDSTKIVVQVPSAAFKEGRLARELENPVLYNVFIRGGGAKILATVTAAVRGLGFTTVEPRSGPVEGNPRLTYGGAPRPLLDRVRTAVHQATGMSLPLVREASVTDRDIWLVLPSDAPQGDARLPAPPPPRSSGTRHKRSGKATGRRSVRIESDCVEIGGQRIARRLENDTAHVPLLERFQPYCLDAVTVATLCHLRSAVSFCEPCALEGATSTSKTSSILFLASLLNQPVFRLNLNGQTDTGDLIGRFVPAQDGGWRFHEGLLVTAMRKGYWIILDEINLAEPAVLERLNSVLERFPTLVLSEYDNSVIEPHENFRIFATLNPAGDYVGREAMSPAFRDRWQAYLYIPRSGESEYLALAQLVVRGCQPAISVGDESFDGFVDAAPLTDLSQVRGIDKFLRAFARFHASVEAAAEPDESGVSRLGAGRRERYVFTRRGFTNTLWYMERALDGERHERRAAAIGWRAIERYYLNKLASPADRTAVTELARAAGISADGWKDLA